MIEKLEKHLASNINSCNMSQNIMVAHKAIEKINEIVDLLNAIVVDIDGTTCIDGSKKPVGPYAEQRWVGHLCKLWTGDGLVRYGILRGIALNRKKTNYPYQALSTSFEHCEPVKLDSELIYHGE